MSASLNSGLFDSRLPQGPRLDAHAWLDFERRQPQSLEELQARYGPMFTVWSEGRAPRVYVADPAALRQVFISHGTDLRAQGPSLFKDLIGRRSLAFQNGESHRRARHILGRALAAQDHRNQAEIIAGITRAQISRQRQIPLDAFTSDLTRKIIISLLFGEAAQSRCTQLPDQLERSMTSLHNRYSAELVGDRHQALWAHRAFTRARRALRETLLEEIKAARRAPSPSSILATLLDGSEGQDLSNEELRMHLMTLLVAGHETTSAALSWALLHATSQPHYVNKIREETWHQPVATYPTTPFLQAYCHEVLRHTSPVPNGHTRRTLRELNIAKYTFPSGTELCPCIHNLHHNHRLHQQPDHFRPERFLNAATNTDTYLPFGIGSRRCLGESLAMQELAIAVAITTHHPDLKIEAPETANPEKVSMGPTIRTPDSMILRT
ncbi:cytochrome P450 [Actinomadura rubrisoli]|uniref:Cytochrome P450 n=1 Tax=Actinomadura rubrisoli TaxID=2530368 RepID=A0A4R5BZF1_9ACTN|nr:cytochrome P450 [Actinomadura rubrisoli]TDD92631.1 cytochrome P450 [Actinomadura rubrisoli]